MNDIVTVWLVLKVTSPDVAPKYLLSFQLQPHWRYVSELDSKPLSNVIAMVVPLETERMHCAIYKCSSINYDVQYEQSHS